MHGDQGGHAELIGQVKEQLNHILDNSQQAIYIYLDDEHKVCNSKFATMLGYSSPEEWAKVTESFPIAFVAEKSQEQLVATYQEAMENCVGSKVDITWKKKGGDEVDSSVILVPIALHNHLLALHFIEEV